jgi:hypothetical protein
MVDCPDDFECGFAQKDERSQSRGNQNDLEADFKDTGMKT